MPSDVAERYHMRRSERIKAERALNEAYYAYEQGWSRWEVVETARDRVKQARFIERHAAVAAIREEGR